MRFVLKDESGKASGRITRALACRDFVADKQFAGCFPFAGRKQERLAALSSEFFVKGQAGRLYWIVRGKNLEI